MKRVLASFLMASLMLLLAVPLFAGQGDSGTKAAPTRTNFGGAIGAVSATSITVKTPKGDMTAAITDKTRVSGGQTGMKISDLKAGDQVRVWVSKDGSGNWMATTIRVIPNKKKV